MHLGPITSVVVGRDGNTVYTGGYDKRVYQWNRTTGEATLLHKHEHLVNHLSLSSDGTLLACASADYTVSLIDLKQKQHVKTLYGHNDDVEMVLFGLNDSKLVTSSQDTHVKVWDLATGCIVTDFREHQKVVNAIWCYEDKVFSCADDGNVFIWEMLTGKILDKLSFSRDLDAASGNTQISLFAVGCDDGTVTLYDARHLHVVRVLQAHERGVKSIAFSPSGQSMLTAGYDHQINIWSVEQGSLLQQLPSSRYQWERSFAWTPDEAFVIGGSFGNTYCEWSITDGTLLTNHVPLSSPSINDLSINSQGIIVTASDDGIFRCGGRERGHSNLVLTNAVCTTPDGRIAAWGDHLGHVHLFHLLTNQNLARLDTGTGPVNTIKYCESDHSFYVGTYGGFVHQLKINEQAWGDHWRAHTGAVKSLEVLPDTVVTGSSEGKIRLFRRHDPRNYQEIVGPTVIVNDLCLTPDATGIVVVGRDKIVRIFCLKTGKILAQHKQHRYSIKSVTTLADGTVVSGDYWGYVAVWNPQQNHVELKRVATNGISALRAFEDRAYGCSYDGLVFEINRDAHVRETFRLFDQSKHKNSREEFVRKL